MLLDGEHEFSAVSRDVSPHVISVGVHLAVSCTPQGSAELELLLRPDVLAATVQPSGERSNGHGPTAVQARLVDSSIGPAFRSVCEQSVRADPSTKSLTAKLQVRAQFDASGDHKTRLLVMSRSGVRFPVPAPNPA